MQRKKVTLISLLLLIFLLMSDSATAQCRKRVLLYLDVSKTMFKQQGDSTPFQVTLDALRRLIEDPDFFGPDDELNLVLFGRMINAQPLATGQDAARLLLADVENRAKGFRSRKCPTPTDEQVCFSDFETVIDDIQTRLSDQGGFQGELVVLASDFVHEPGRTRNPNRGSDELLLDWRAIAGSMEARFKTLFQTDPRRALLLLEAPPGSKASVADVVLDNFSTAIEPAPARSRVSAVAPDVLAQTIRRAFVFSPIIDVIKHSDGGGQFSITVTNRNCSPQILSGLTATCKRQDRSAAAAPISILIPPEKERLEPIGTPDNGDRVTVTVPFSRFKGCPEGATNYDFEVVTEEGAKSSKAADSRSDLSFDPQSAADRWILIGDELQVLVAFQGTLFERRVERFEVRAPDGKRLASRKFALSPEDFRSGENRLLRFNISLGAVSDVRGDQMISLVQDSAQEELVREKLIPSLRRDWLKTLGLYLQSGLVGLVWIVVLISWLRRGLGTTTSLTTANTVWDIAWGQLGTAFASGLALFLHWILPSRPLVNSSRELAILGLLLLCFSIFVFLWRRRALTDGLEREYQRGFEMVAALSPQELLKGVKDFSVREADGHKPLVFALVTFVVLFALIAGAPRLLDDPLTTEFRQARPVPTVTE